MGHVEIENKAEVAAECLFLTDENGRPLLVPLLQATFDIVGTNQLRIADSQKPIDRVGSLYGKDAATSSYRYEPPYAFTKLTTDVVLHGHAWAPRADATQVDVTLKAGALHKTIRVTGDRTFTRRLGRTTLTAAKPFVSIPLIYERAFGGWDRSHPDPARHRCEPRNPVGVGFRLTDDIQEDVLAPNLESVDSSLRHLGQVVTPAGFGWVSPDWQPRCALAGKYDAAWQKSRRPLLPEDFDRRFFNAGAAGLIANSYFKGDELIRVENATPRGPLEFQLSGPRQLSGRVRLAGQADVILAFNLDTVIIDTDAHQVLLMYRTHVPLRNGPHDVQELSLTSQEAA